MKSILRELQELADADLFALSDAVELELSRREAISGETADSARRRATERQQSYRRRTGAAAPPVRVIGLGKTAPPRRAA